MKNNQTPKQKTQQQKNQTQAPNKWLPCKRWKSEVGHWSGLRENQIQWKQFKNCHVLVFVSTHFPEDSFLYCFVALITKTQRCTIDMMQIYNADTMVFKLE